ncbi:MAG: glycosyltransferase, partial [Bacteroidota bacterium]
MKNHRIVLIGNYPPDRQESMERFAQMLAQEYDNRGYSTAIWRPRAFFVRTSKRANRGINKWLGYLDKWIIYPLVLALRSRGKRDTTFHICDHSNAPYLGVLPRKKTVVTCHDVLAIRGALGFKDAHCEASGMGKVLQQYIRYFLVRAQKIACVSGFTLRQLRDLAPARTTEDGDWKVIYNAFNARFYPMPTEEKAAGTHLATYG